MPHEDEFDPAAPSPVALKEALDRMRGSLESMPASDVIRPKLDAASAAGVVIGSLPRIVKHRGGIEEHFGEEGATYVDELPVIAYATQQAHIELAAADSMSDLTAQHAEIAEDHQLLLTDADALANRKLIDRARVDAGRPAQGYLTTVTSVLVLVALLREHWSVIEGKTPLRREELDAIERRAQAMLKRLNERDQGSSRLPAAEMRTRALSKLVRSYGEVQRMLTYVRWWEDDASSIAPSLFANRRKGGRNDVVVGEDDVVVDPSVPALPPPADPNNGGPFTG